MSPNQKGSASLHTGDPLDLNLIKAALFSVWISFRGSRRDSLCFACFSTFLSASAHLSASSRSALLTGSICGVSQLVFKGGEARRQVRLREIIPETLGRLCETALHPPSCAWLCGCKSVFALTDLFPGVPAWLLFRPGHPPLALKAPPQHGNV